MEGLRTNALVSHDESTKHKLCMRKQSFKENTSAIKPIKQVLQQMEMQLEHCMVNAFHVAYYIAKNEKPYANFPDLTLKLRRATLVAKTKRLRSAEGDFSRRAGQ